MAVAKVLKDELLYCGYLISGEVKPAAVNRAEKLDNARSKKLRVSTRLANINPPMIQESSWRFLFPRLQHQQRCGGRTEAARVVSAAKRPAQCSAGELRMSRVAGEPRCRQLVLRSNSPANSFGKGAKGALERMNVHSSASVCIELRRSWAAISRSAQWPVPPCSGQHCW
jgi:hypothetical protein